MAASKIAAARSALLGFSGIRPRAAAALQPKIQQKCSLMSKAFREPGYQRPPPFPYKTKKYNVFTSLIDDTSKRFDENSKIIVVEGPPSGEKDKFCQEIANELDMLYIPPVNMDTLYIDEYGNDKRSLNPKLPASVKFFDVKDFLRDPSCKLTTRLQFDLFRLRFDQYLDALEHLLNTGQGVVLHRSIFSDSVFFKTLWDCKFITSPKSKPYYHQLFKEGTVLFPKPHLYIYLDIPVDVILQNVKARNRPEEANSPFYTSAVLETLEKNYKSFLKMAEKRSEVVIYDWPGDGSAEEVVDDISRINLDKYGPEDDKMRDWYCQKEHEWGELRILFSQYKDVHQSFLNIPCHMVPELNPPSDDVLVLNELEESLPGATYDKGFNADMGEKYLFHWKR